MVDDTTNQKNWKLYIRPVCLICQLNGPAIRYFNNVYLDIAQVAIHKKKRKMGTLSWYKTFFFLCKKGCSITSSWILYISRFSFRVKFFKFHFQLFFCFDVLFLLITKLHRFLLISKFWNITKQTRLDWFFFFVIFNNCIFIVFIYLSISLTWTFYFSFTEIFFSYHI